MRLGLHFDCARCLAGRPISQAPRPELWRDAIIKDVLADFTPGAVVDFINEFLRTVPDRLATLQGAVARGDAVALRHEAHALKGESIMFGATELQEAAFQLEQLGLQGTLAGAEEHLAAVRRAFERTKPELEAIRARYES